MIFPLQTHGQEAWVEETESITSHESVNAKNRKVETGRKMKKRKNEEKKEELTEERGKEREEERANIK